MVSLPLNASPLDRTARGSFLWQFRRSAIGRWPHVLERAVLGGREGLFHFRPEFDVAARRPTRLLPKPSRDSRDFHATACVALWRGGLHICFWLMVCGGAGVPVFGPPQITKLNPRSACFLAPANGDLMHALR